MKQTRFEVSDGPIYGYHNDGRNICAKCARETINDLELCRRWQPLTTSETCDECGSTIEKMSGFKEVTLNLTHSSDYTEYEIGEANGETWLSVCDLMVAMEEGMSEVGAAVTWDGEIVRNPIVTIHNQSQLLHIMCAEHDNGDFDYFGIVED